MIHKCKCGEDPCKCHDGDFVAQGIKDSMLALEISIAVLLGVLLWLSFRYLLP